jgi:RNA polymerase sigma factor (sigma-70 family)
MSATTQTATRKRRTRAQVARLVRAAARDDRGAWNALVDEFGGMVWAIARAHRLSDADAADVSQATWVLVFEHLDSILEPERIGAWLATTARRECLRVLRAAQRCVLVEEEPAEAGANDPGLDGLLTAERDAALWHCFARLRPSDQALLRLLVADPRPPYEEISAALDMPMGSIGPTRARALARLHKELQREGHLSLMTD